MRCPPVLSDAELIRAFESMRWLAPHERREMRQLLACEYTDERGMERTHPVTVRLPISLLLRLHVERAHIRRRRRVRTGVTMSDALRIALSSYFLAQTEQASAAEVPESAPGPCAVSDDEERKAA